jgi:4-hydroxybenzoyl-CoA thioesterase
MDRLGGTGNNHGVKHGASPPMFISRRSIRVDWGHCDPAGIVFYPNYFRWFDECTSALFENAGLPLPRLYREHGLKGFPLLDARATFAASASFGDDLAAQSCVVEWNAKTLKVQHRFLRGGSLVVEGWELRVCVVAHPDDPARLKSTAIPDEVKRRLGG